jgi:hypothetical protein
MDFYASVFVPVSWPHKVKNDSGGIFTPKNWGGRVGGNWNSGKNQKCSCLYSILVANGLTMRTTYRFRGRLGQRTQRK